MTQPQTPTVTEDDIAQFLAASPDFFERHAELLAKVQLSSPHGQRAVSLQERQAEMLREKIRVLERRVLDMIRHGNENVVIANRLHTWTLGLFDIASPGDLPSEIAAGIQSQFMVPQAVVKMWDCKSAYADRGFAQGVSEDARAFASSLSAAYCGANVGFEAADWLPEPEQAASLAMIPLRPGSIQDSTPAFGMLVLASPDLQRFHDGMGTEFLERTAELASAALAQLRP